MRLFRRIPKKCNTISFTYNHLKPEQGVQLYLGVGESDQEIAYHHFEVDELEWLINLLQRIQSGYNKHGD